MIRPMGEASSLVEPALERSYGLASHSFLAPFGRIRLPSYYTGDAQGRDEGSLPLPPLPGYPQPASLGLPPRSDRSLRLRRALAHDCHPATVTNATPPHSSVRAHGPGIPGARSEASASEVCLVFPPFLRALGTLASSPGFLR